MTAIRIQASCLIHIVAQQPQGVVSVQIKYRKIHSNASSK